MASDTSHFIRAIRLIFGVLLAGSWILYRVHQHDANSALADAPDPGPLTLGQATVSAPDGFVLVTQEMALARDETVAPDEYYGEQFHAHPIVLVRRDRGSERHPDLAVIELDQAPHDVHPSSVTDADCAALGAELAQDRRVTLVRTEVRPLPAGSSCIMQTITPPRTDATTIVWLVSTEGSDYFVRCVVDPHRAEDLAACEAFGRGLRV
jgi:hypothetical protein